ncbi:tetratricopeptide repeat protein [Flavobacterium sp.]|uniref:tetratricopeptide repeat protein n=1 Tax=Flavobacterium sp. TaxID=239 RepID=UPI0026087F9C|nr:tetratricopeptide repeat protein [Flavobacterium sp.]
MKKTLLLFLFLPHFVFSQNDVNKLLDSLTISLQDKDKARISLKIATELKDTNWKRALHYIEFSEELVKKIDLEEVTAENNTKIAEIYNEKDAFDIALTYYLKAYEFYQQDNKNEKKYHLENSLAIIYARLNNKEKAMHYFNNLLKHHTQNKSPIFIAKTLNNIGTLYMSNQALDSAMTYFKKSLLLTENLKDEELRTILYNNLGICYTQKNNFEQAKLYFNKSISYANKKSDNKTKAWIYNSLSKLYLSKKQSDSALFYSKKAADLLKDVKYSFENKNAVFNIYKSYLLKEDYKNAATYFENYDQIRDSLNIEGKAMNVEKLKLEQQYKENEELRILKESKENSKYYAIAFSLIIVMLVLFILLMKYKNKLSKAQLEKDLFESKKKELDANLELKNKELVAHSMMEIQRTEIVEQILDDLKQLKLQSPKKETQQTFDLIIKQLSQNNNTNVWEEFELHYGQVYESFYNILNEKHPELTYRDKRLCALLKLNLTTKEIAQITGQSIKSLENARTRLRKKLNLTNTNVDLITYLVNLN